MPAARKMATLEQHDIVRFRDAPVNTISGGAIVTDLSTRRYAKSCLKSSLSVSSAGLTPAARARRQESSCNNS